MKSWRVFVEQQVERATPSLWFTCVSLPLAIIYLWLVNSRNRRFDKAPLRSKQLPGRVISIGNVVVGGTGKSPITIAFAKRILERGGRPVILARGYGSGLKAHESMVLRGGQIIWQSHRRSMHPSDEGLMQSMALPEVFCVLGPNRYDAANAFLRRLPKDEYPTHWLLDDGFQHRQIARNADVVLVDAQNPLGSGRLLPSGNLREPPEALSRADLIIATRAMGHGDTNKVEEQLRPYYSGPVLAVEFETTLPEYDPAIHAPSLVVAGIAKPERFLQKIRDLGVLVGDCLWFADHQKICTRRLQRALASCRSIITTSKDYWRDPEVFAQCNKSVLIADLKAKIDFSLVDRLLF